MTQLLYLHDGYLREFDATVTAADGQRVALDRTAFYAGGGGQPADTGVLRWGSDAARVVELRKEDAAVWHTVEGAVPPPGAAVQGVLDWERRFGLMRHHTAAHVIAAILHHEFKAKFTGGQLYPDRARIDVHFDAWDPALPKRIEERANAEIAKGYDVKHYEMSREEF